MFEKIEVKTKAKQQQLMAEDEKQGIDSDVSESIERSMFGYFSINYNKYNLDPSIGNKDRLEIWKNIFSATKILKQDVYRSLLYFNLPFKDIIA